MIAFRDVLIFAGLMALAAAVITSLFPVRENVTPVPACSDCAFKLTGGYWVLQHSSYASLYLGTREVARYGWAYVDGWPLRIGENVTCNPMYVYVLNGIAYITCRDGGSVLGRRALLSVTGGVTISSNPRGPGCTYTVSVSLNASTTVRVEVYDENNRLVYSASGTPPATFTINVPVAGTYRMRVYAPLLFDQWYTLQARVDITASNAAVYASNDTRNPRSFIALKIFDLTNYWKKGYTNVTVYVNPAGASFTLSAPSNAFADFLLAWEECSDCIFDFIYKAIAFLYIDEVWRLTFTPSGPVFARIQSQGGYWHEVYADGRLIYTWNKDGPKNDRYTGSDPTITVRFVSEDSFMNAEATFTKVCAWR
jgi:hypothetical protein